MTKMVGLLAIAATLLVGMPAPVDAAGGPFDGTVPLICAAIDVMDCTAGGDCQRRSAEAVNLPQFVAIDFKGQSMSTTDGSGRTAPIQRLDRMNGQITLQGGQAGRVWSMVIAGDTGKLSAGVVDPDGAFLVFGACTAR